MIVSDLSTGWIVSRNGPFRARYGVLAGPANPVVADRWPAQTKTGYRVECAAGRPQFAFCSPGLPLEVFTVERSCLSLLLVSTAVSFATAPIVLGQEVKPSGSSTFRRLEPLRRPNVSAAQMDLINAQTANGSTIPLWNYSIVAGQDGKRYQGSIVGRSPYYHGFRSTTVRAYLVPVILTFPDGSVFNPSSYDSCVGNSVVDLVQNSPIFQSTDFTFTDSNGNNPVDVGTTQYADATQRANFWKYVAPTTSMVLPYHTLLGLNTLPAVDVIVPAGYGYANPGPCGYGVMDYNWWDNYVTSMLIPSLSGQGIGSANLPIFIFDSVVMYLDGSVVECCALGDHGSYLNAQNGLLQTYIVANFDTTGTWGPDITALSHEVGEWMNDPDNINPTPLWGNIGQVQGCADNYEVGDALSGAVYPVPMPNGFTYHPQELVYFSWFYDQVPSIGAGGWYSDQGTFTTDSGPVCQGSPNPNSLGPLAIKTRKR